MINIQEPVSFTIERVSIDIGERDLINLGLTVTELERIPGKIKKGPPGLVHKLIEIVIPEAALEDIAGAEIELNMEKSWLNKHELDKRDVILARFDEIAQEWEELDMRIIGETETIVKPSARSARFSIFATIAKLAAAAPAAPVGLDLIAMLWAIIGLLAGILVLLIILMTRKR